MDSADMGGARRYAAVGWPSDTPAAVVNAAVAEFCASGEPALLDSLVSRAWLDLVLGSARTPWRFVEDMRAVVDAAGDDVVMMVRRPSPVSMPANSRSPRTAGCSA